MLHLPAGKEYSLEASRCLKHYIARKVYFALNADQSASDHGLILREVRPG